MRTPPLGLRLSYGLLALAAATVPAARASSTSSDIAGVAEHVPESAQDARHFLLPWPVEPLEAGRWQTAFDVGGLAAAAGPLEIRGTLASVGATRGLSARWGVELLGFVDRFSVSGGEANALLRDPLHGGTPLALPAAARFGGAEGTMRHEGAGVGAVRELSPADAAARWTLRFGALVERLELSDYRVDYRLLSGADSGAAGTLDFSSTATYLTPYLGCQRISPLGARWRLAFRLSGGVPLPEGDFDARVTGPGFDLATARGDGEPGRIGDAFVALGVGFVHPSSGIDLDVGSLLSFPAFELATHQGVDRAFLVHLTWHPRPGHAGR